MIRAVIFDMDGVLADTDKARFDILKTILGKRNYVLSDDLYKRCVGRKTKVYLREFFPEMTDRELSQIYDERNALLHARPAEHVAELPFARACVRALAESGLPLALASSSRRAEIDLILHEIGIHEHFSVIISSEDITKYKPDPEAYLACAHALGVAPEACAAIEDSPVGIASAKAAGCYAIAVPYAHESEELSQADLIITTLEELPARIQALRGLAHDQSPL